MIRKCGNGDRDRILSYIGDEYAHCLYLYLNLQRYGFDSDMIEVYFQMDGDRVGAVMLKYYTCLHVYSRDNVFDASEIGEFFAGNGFTMLYCMKETGEHLYTALPGAIRTKATITNGWVARVKSLDREPDGLSTPAQADDFDQIVRLIYDDDDIGRSYNYDDLSRQLVERNKEGYTRNLVIKQDGLVIAHICTNAEFGDIAVIAELLVRKEHRRKGYATGIMRDICGELLSEGKEVYSFYYSEESRLIHERLGFNEICKWAKIVLNR